LCWLSSTTVSPLIWPAEVGDLRWAVDGEVVDGQDSAAKRLKNLGDPAANASQTNDANRRAGQVAGGPADKLLRCLLRQEERKPTGAGDRQAKGMLGHLISKNPRSTGHRDRRVDNRWNEAVVEPRGR